MLILLILLILLLRLLRNGAPSQLVAKFRLDTAENERSAVEKLMTLATATTR